MTSHPTLRFVPTSAEWRAAALRAIEVAATHREDGSILLQWPEHTISLAPGSAAADAPVHVQAPNVVDWLAVWAAVRPDAIFMAERDGAATSAPWQRVSYLQAWQEVQPALAHCCF